MLEGYVVLALVSACCHGISHAMQKHGVHQQVPGLELKNVLRSPLAIAKSLVRQPVWLAGVAVQAVAIVLGIQALSSGDLTVVMPLMTLTILVVILIGIFVFKERLRGMEWSGIAVMIIGAGLLIGSAGDRGVGVPDRGISLAVWVVGLVLALFLVWCSRLKPRSRELLYTSSAAVLVAITDTLTKAATEYVELALGRFAVNDPQVLIALALEPTLYMTMMTYLGGFVLTQIAFAQGRVSVILPVRIMLSLLCTTALGILLFSEPVGALRWSALVLMLIGVLFLADREAVGEKSPQPKPPTNFKAA